MPWIRLSELPKITDAIQVWQVSFPDYHSALDVCLATLTQAEQDRAAKTRAGQARNQFVIGRALLRLLLGTQLRMNPSDVPLCLNPHGKPNLSPYYHLWFNAAHSHETLMLGATCSGPLGIDVEYVNPALDLDELAPALMTEQELTSLCQLPASLRRAEFYRCWTCKEAVLKADGCGLTISLPSFTAPTFPNASVLLPPHGCNSPAEFHTRALDFSPEYKACIACVSPHLGTLLYTMSPEAVIKALQRTNVLYS